MRYTAIAPLLCLICAPLMASTNLTYQGQLDASGTPFSGTVSMQFQLYDSEADGNPVGPQLDRSAVEVTDGLFQVDLDFGNVFDGPRWLQITVEETPLDSRQRVAPAPTAIRADTLDGLDSTAFQQAFTRTLVVSPSGNAAADGAALLDTVSSINDATTSSPVQVLIEPGTYTLDQTLDIPANVYVRGAGQQATRITRTGSIDIPSFDVITMTGPSGLSHMSVLAFGGGSDNIDVVDIDGNGDMVRLEQVSVRAQGANNLSYGVRGNSASNATLRIGDSRIELEGGAWARGILVSVELALFVHDSTVVVTGASSVMDGLMVRGNPDSRLVNSRIESGEDGIYSDNGVLIVRNSEVFGQDTGASGHLAIYDSRIEAVDNGVISTISGVTAPVVANSQLVGPSSLVGDCVAIYDGSFAFYPERCP